MSSFRDIGAQHCTGWPHRGQDGAKDLNDAMPEMPAGATHNVGLGATASMDLVHGGIQFDAWITRRPRISSTSADESDIV